MVKKDKILTKELYAKKFLKKFTSNNKNIKKNKLIQKKKQKIKIKYI